MLHKFILRCALFLTLVLIAACQGLAGEPVVVATLPPRATSVPVSAPAAPPDLALGAQVYAANCTRCHGSGGQGDGEFVQSGQITSIMDFTDPLVTSGQTPADYFRIITEGNLQTLMPPWGDELSAAQRWAAALYVYTLSYRPEQIAQGQQIWQANCAECHGSDGRGAPNGAPLPDLNLVSDEAARATVNNGLDRNRMPGFAAEIGPIDQAAVVAYARMLMLANSGIQIAQAATPLPATPLPATQNAPTAAATSAETPQPPNATPEVQPPAAGPIGSIFGQVVNGTAGAAVPPGLLLTLHVIDAEFNDNIYTATADASGLYRFVDVPMLTDHDYILSTTYHDITFVSEVSNDDPTASEIPSTITIYELGAEASAINIDGMMTQISVENGVLQLVQIVSFVNLSDRVYLNRSGSSPTSLAVSVPRGMIYTDFMGGGYAVSADGRLVFDDEAIVPGMPHLMHLSFSAPYTPGLTVDQPLLYALTGRFEVLVGTDGLTISSSALTEQSQRVLGNQVLNSYAANISLPSGQTVAYGVNGTPTARTQPTSAASDISPLAYILIGVGIGTIGVAGGMYLLERRSAARKPAPATPSSGDLMKQIADLDIAHREGKVERAAYERQRAALKAQLTELMRGPKP
ncbi:MAG: c-type cytochrome [Chloroflexi bacterium]|nr:c-type cytochrome [Chloroflexota bacterium]